MIDQEQLDRWQAPPEDCAYLAVQEMSYAMDNLYNLLLTRDGVKFLRGEARNLMALKVQLVDLVNEIQPSIMEAAE